MDIVPSRGWSSESLKTMNESIRFRPSLGTSVLVLGGFSVAALISTVVSLSARADHEYQRFIGLVMLVGPCALAVHLLWCRPCVSVTRHTIKVVGPLTSTIYQTSDVARFEGGLRLQMVLSSGERVPIWAVQNTQWTEMRGAWGPSDEAAKRLNEFLGIDWP